MTTTDARLRYASTLLRQGKVKVITALSDPATLTPTTAIIQVVGHRSTYAVDLHQGDYQCSCVSDGGECAHILAARLVTGRAS